MTPPLSSETNLVDYWHEVARRGVLSLRFIMQDFSGEAWMAAELSGPRSGMVLRSALAALEIDKAIAAENGSPAWLLRSALFHNLQAGSASQDLAAYQDVLIKHLHESIEAGPAEALTRLAAPHEPADRYGRS